MSVYKDAKSNTWFVKARYKDWTGATKNLMKRGFALKREALEWEASFFSRQSSSSLDMTFNEFYALYKEEMSVRLKESTWDTKCAIIESKILPFFKNLRIRDISSKEVIRWQNEMLKAKQLNGKPYSQTYLKTIHNQLSAIFNYAMRFYKLQENPASIAGAIGEKEGDEMRIWSEDEYRRFSEAIMDKSISFYCFEMLYWCGIREGELLALTKSDFDLQKRQVRINKTYHRRNRTDVITPPKTKQSVRTVSMPAFLCEEMEEYFSTLYELEDLDRVFPVTKNFLSREMTRGAAASGVQRIRIHDLRHSHVSLLIHMGYSAVAIAKRVGHKSIDITYRYAHLFPSVQDEISEELNQRREEDKHVS